MRYIIYLLVFLSIVVHAISLDTILRKAPKDNDDELVDEPISGSKKFSSSDDEPVLISSNRRNRFPSQGSSSNSHRSRSRWPSSSSSSSSLSSYDDRADFMNDWLPIGYGSNGPFPSLSGGFPPTAFDTGSYLSNGPTCHSLLDPIYPLFADICGSVPQARYSLPNAFGHTERWQIAQVLSVLLGPSTPSVANPVCSRSLRLLVCPLLFPPCPTRFEAPPVLPCQPFCRIVKNQCASPSLDLLPCDLLPPTSDLCPINPTPYSSLLSSFGSPLPTAGPLSQLGFPQSPLSSLLAQSALAGFSPVDMPPSMLQSLLAQSAALTGGVPPTDMFPSPFSPMLSPSPFTPGLTPPGFTQSGFTPPGLTPPGFTQSGFTPSGLTSPGVTPTVSIPSSPASGVPTSGITPTPTQTVTQTLTPTPNGIPPGLASLFSPPTLSPFLSPLNPFMNRDAFMGDNLAPILVDFPPIQYSQPFGNPLFFPRIRSATEKA